MFKAEIIIHPKADLLDPQSSAVLKTIQTNVNCKQVTSVQLGKHILLLLAEKDKAKATATVEHLCQTVLVQPMLEDYHFQIQEVE